MGEIEKMEIIVSFKKDETQLYRRIKTLRGKSAFMKDAAAEKFQREDEAKSVLQSQPRKSIQPPRGFDV